MKNFICFCIVVFCITGCAGNKYIPPESGPRSTFTLKMVSKTGSSKSLDRNISGSIFLFNDADDCNAATQFVLNTKRNRDVVLQAESPITLGIYAYYETHDYRKTTYYSKSLFSFIPEKGKNYEITGDYSFFPLLKKTGGLAIPFTVASSVIDLTTGQPVKIIERRYNIDSPTGCDKSFSEFKDSDYLYKTSDTSFKP